MNEPCSGVWASQEGTPYPLGASYVEQARAFNFAIYSKHAERVTLLLFAESNLGVPMLSYEFDYLRNKSGAIWHCRISAEAVEGAAYYGYQIDGPPPGPAFDFHRFDHEKLLLDPYAHAVHFPVEFSRDAARRPGSNVGQAALASLPRAERQFDWGDEARPWHDSDLVIYELHIRGLTRHESSGVEPSRRETVL